MAIIMSVMIGSTALTGCGNQPEVTETANGNVVVTTHESSFFNTMIGFAAGTMLGNMIGNAIWGNSFSENIILVVQKVALLQKLLLKKLNQTQKIM